MLTSIHIEGFKSFKDTKIEPLRKVNLILGGQNVGKTSLLEAVWLEMNGGKNGYSTINLPSTFREAEGKDFERFNRSVLKTTTLIYLEHNLIFPKNIPVTFSINHISQSTMVQVLDQVVIKRKKSILLSLLNCIENRLQDIQSLSPDGESRVYVDLDDSSDYLPIQQLGHGFSRLLYLYCKLLVTDSKLALIDEIENGIHYSSLPTMFKGIQQIATNNDIQSLITTHSWECICAAYNVFAEAGRLEDFQLIRLEQEGDNVRAVIIKDKNLETVMEAGYEIR